jgi:nitrate reductase beta subunit
VCSETCVGRIRYLGVMLYDADRIEEAASVENEQHLYRAQLDIFLDPSDPAVIAQTRADGVPELWLEAARNSPVYKMAIEWGVAFPLHPEYRTLPMVWYVPPLSPIQGAHQAGHIGWDEKGLPDVNALRIPVRYLANLLTAGAEAPVVLALQRMMAMRMHMRARTVEGRMETEVLKQVGLSVEQVEAMYQVMAIANYEDRFVIPATHREYAESAFDLKSACGFSFGNGCSTSVSTGANLFSARRTSAGHQSPRVEIRRVAAKLRAARRNPNPMPSRRPVVRHVAAPSGG